MAGYSIIVSSIHSDEEFKALTATQQLLYFKLLTHPFHNKAGFFHLDIEYTARMMMRCTQAKLKKELLAETDLWKYDESTDVILIPNYLKYNKAAGSKSLTGLKRELEQLPKTRLCVEFIYKFYELTNGEGLCYLPKQMVETAIALTKNQESVMHSLVYKYITTLL